MKIFHSDEFEKHPMIMTALYCAIVYGVFFISSFVTDSQSVITFFPGTLVSLFVPVFLWNIVAAAGIPLLLLIVVCVLTDIYLRKLLLSIKYKVLISLLLLFTLTMIFDIYIWGGALSLSLFLESIGVTGVDTDFFPSWHGRVGEAFKASDKGQF